MAKEEEKKKTNLVAEFKDFLKEYKIVGLAIAFIMGAAATALIKSLVDNIIMPIITPFIQDGAWREAVLAIGPIVMKWGQFLADFIYFIFLAIVVFLFAKYILKEEKVSKK